MTEAARWINVGLSTFMGINSLLQGITLSYGASQASDVGAWEKLLVASAWLTALQSLVQLGGSFVIENKSRECFHKILPFPIMGISVCVTIIVIVAQSRIIN